MSKEFQLISEYKPTGDQPKAIEYLVSGLQKKTKHQTLLGVTGSGKTFTMANVIQQVQRPTLVMAHNKTLAAQLASEFREFFPNNAVHYFVSYYDYYQPEAYIPTTDTFIEKDAQINEEIDKYRHAATVSLLTRRDVIVVASVSCIYGLGAVEDYTSFTYELTVGKNYVRDEFLKRLIEMQYQRSVYEFKQGMFSVLGDIIEVFPPNLDHPYRLEFFGDELEKIVLTDFITGEVYEELNDLLLFPAKHFVTPMTKIERVVTEIRKDMEEQVAYFTKREKILEAQRIKQRTEYDIEMLTQLGYTQGIENYSRYFDGRPAGDPPTTLIDYFPKDFLLFVDESHVTIPQVGGMFMGDQARKQNLIEYGFRLPSAKDNRPLKFAEFESKVNQAVYVSATPSKYEAEKSKGAVAEQLIRPTGLLDPIIEVRPEEGQVDDAMYEITERIKIGDRVLITTLTKKMAEDLTKFLDEHDFKVAYLHSDIDTMERIEIIRNLRLGKIDVLVGINLLREGLDIPEVSLITIFDADKQGFLRSETALIQTIGRCARNERGKVIMYARKMSPAMEKAISETTRRRKIQAEHNIKHGITPTTIYSKIKDIPLTKRKEDEIHMRAEMIRKDKKSIKKKLVELELQMDMHAANLEFEKAAEVRDLIEELKK